MNQKILFIIFGIGILVLGFIVGCGEEIEETNKEPNTDGITVASPIVGTWTGKMFKKSEEIGYAESIKLQFYSDGTWTDEVGVAMSSFYGVFADTEYFSGTYTITGNKVEGTGKGSYDKYVSFTLYLPVDVGEITKGTKITKGTWSGSYTTYSNSDSETETFYLIKG